MAVETVTLDEALQLLSLPRSVGVDPADSGEIVARNGRYGPYLQKGEETRSLESEEEIFSIGIEAAAEAFTRPEDEGAPWAVAHLSHARARPGESARDHA